MCEGKQHCVFAIHVKHKNLMVFFPDRTYIYKKVLKYNKTLTLTYKSRNMDKIMDKIIETKAVSSSFFKHGQMHEMVTTSSPPFCTCRPGRENVQENSVSINYKVGSLTDLFRL